MQPITDLDELVLKVRDPESKSLFGEAVQAFRAGVFRSAVTSTWIAVVADVFSKVRELAISGDKNAAAFIQRLDTAVSSEDIPTLQKIESGILAVAADEFELLSPQEHEDLARLQRDRNLCAHPALVSDQSLFQPTPELVRVHLVHAGSHLLRHPPVQGKSALARVVSEIARPSFPQDPERAFAYLAERLARAKDALVRNLIVVLLKNTLFDNDASLAGRPIATLNALAACARIRADIYERETKIAVTKWLENTTDEQTSRVLRLAASDVRCWEWVPSPARLRALETIRRSPPQELAKAGAFDALSLPAARGILLERFAALDNYEKQSVIAENPRPEFADEAVELFSWAGSFRGAESLAESVILPMASSFSAEHLTKILKAACKNEQIWYASKMPAILVQLFDATIDRFASTRGDWQAFVEFVIPKNEEGDHFSYPALQQRLQARGVTFATSPASKDPLG